MENKDKSLQAEVWQTLSKINVSEHVGSKGGMTYLPWSWAWATLMEHYPESWFQVDPEDVQDDGTVMCNVTVGIENGGRSVRRKMWLPVMDHRNNAIAQPTTRQVSDCRMRCLVKALGLFGLGFYIYSGEDMPTAESRALSEPISDEQATELENLLNEAGGNLIQFCKFLKVNDLSEVSAGNFEAAKGMINRKREASK